MTDDDRIKDLTEQRHLLADRIQHFLLRAGDCKEDHIGHTDVQFFVFDLRHYLMIKGGPSAVGFTLNLRSPNIEHYKAIMNQLIVSLELLTHLTTQQTKLEKQCLI